MRKVAWLISVVFALTQAAEADDRAAQVEAARVAAQARIVEMINDEPIGQGYTVRDFIARMDAEARLWDVLSAGQHVGGARWIDEETCQVRVDVPAIRVGELLLDLALARPNRTPVAYDRLEKCVLRWNRRSFSATASSLTWQRAEQLVPPESVHGWANVDPARRRTALEAARQSAGRQLAQSVIAVDEVGEPQVDPSQAEQISQWVRQQPVTSVQFRDDQSVQVALAVEPAEVRRRFGERAAENIRPIVTGVARVESEADHPERVVIPVRPPSWVDQLLDATGDAKSAGSPLKTARLAERAAQDVLRIKLSLLDFDASQSVGDAATQNQAISSALDRVVLTARVAHVDYRADGSVQVRVTLDGHAVWRELTVSSTSAQPKRE